MAKILIVEDDLLLSRMYQRVLSSKGDEVDIAYDGEEGLEKAKAQKPDLVLLDIMLPKMNGIEVLEKLKSTPSTKEIPVIILSNLTEDTQLDEAMAKGASKYIKKVNSDPMQVADMIREIVQEKSQGKIPEKIPENKEEVNP